MGQFLYLLGGNLLFGCLAFAATWNLNGNGAWNVDGNWTAPALFPNGVDAEADFLTVITGNRTINVTGPGGMIVVGTMTIDDNNRYRFRSTVGDPLVFEVSSGTASLAISNANGNGAHRLLNPIILNSSLIVTQGSPATIRINGDIAGAGGIIKEGTGQLRFQGTGTYGGSTAINEGLLFYNNDGCIPGSSAVSVGSAATATLRVNQDISVGNALAVELNANGTLRQNNGDIIRLLSLSGSGTVLKSTGGGNQNFIDVIGTTDAVFSGTMSGGATNVSTNPSVGNRLLKSGSSTWTLAAPSTLTSRTFIQDGTLVVQSSGALGPPGTGSAVFVQSGGTLSLENNINLFKTVNVNGMGASAQGALANPSGNNEISGPVILGWSGGTQTPAAVKIETGAGSSLTLSSAMAGTVDLTVAGNGRVILSGMMANTYTGAIAVDGGTLELAKTGGVLAVQGDLTVNGGEVVWSQPNQINLASVLTCTSGGLNLNGHAEAINRLIFHSGTLAQGGGELTLLDLSAPLTMRATTIPGDLRLSGGTVVFDATNGGTAVIEGNIDQGGAVITYSVANGPNSIDMRLGGALTDGGLIKEGAGTLLLTGMSTLDSATTVNEGTLIVSGELGGTGFIDVATIAMLQGDGVIAKNMAVRGVLSPGLSIDTLEVMGDVQFFPGSSLEIEIDPFASDQLIVEGSVTIDHGTTLTILPLAGTEPNRTYEIIATTEGISGEFTTVESLFPLFETLVFYTANRLLILEQQMPMTFATFPGNAGAVGECIDMLTMLPGQDISNIVIELMNLPNASEQETALLQMQPSAVTALSIVQQNTTLFLRSALYQHMQPAIFSCKAQRRCDRVEVWGTALNGWDWQENKGREPGYRVVSPGFLVGADALLSREGAVGGGVGYTHAFLRWKQGRGSGEIDSAYLTTYGRWVKERGFLLGALIGSYQHYRGKRDIAFGGVDRRARGSHNGFEGAAHLKGGALFNRKFLRLAPFLRLDYLYLYESSYRETGAESLNLKIKTRHADLLVSGAGIDTSICMTKKNFTLTSAFLLAALFEKRFQGKTVKSTFYGCPLEVSGLYPSRTLFEYGAGLYYQSLQTPLHMALVHKGRYAEQLLEASLFLEIGGCF